MKNIFVAMLALVIGLSFGTVTFAADPAPMTEKKEETTKKEEKTKDGEKKVTEKKETKKKEKK
jgi:hypothetical protein